MFVAKNITELEAKGVHAKYLINNWHFWQNGVPGDLVDTQFEDEEVSDVVIIEART